MVIFLSQKLKKLFIVCVMTGVRTFSFFYFLRSYVLCVRFNDNNNDAVFTLFLYTYLKAYSVHLTVHLLCLEL